MYYQRSEITLRVEVRGPLGDQMAKGAVRVRGRAVENNAVLFDEEYAGKAMTYTVKTGADTLRQGQYVEFSLQGNLTEYGDLSGYTVHAKIQTNYYSQVFVLTRPAARIGVNVRSSAGLAVVGA